MPTAKKTKSRVSTKKTVNRRRSKKCHETTGFDGFLADLTAHKITVSVLVLSVFGLGLLFSVVLGVSAAHL